MIFSGEEDSAINVHDDDKPKLSSWQRAHDVVLRRFQRVSTQVFSGKTLVRIIFLLAISALLALVLIRIGWWPAG